MKKLIEKLEKTFAAVAFAEVGEFAIAMETAEVKPVIGANIRDFSKSVDNIFAAITYAEAGCPEIAQEFLKKDPVQENLQPLKYFLETVGLQGARVCYGMVPI